MTSGVLISASPIASATPPRRARAYRLMLPGRPRRARAPRCRGLWVAVGGDRVGDPPREVARPAGHGVAQPALAPGLHGVQPAGLAVEDGRPRRAGRGAFAQRVLESGAKALAL